MKYQTIKLIGLNSWIYNQEYNLIYTINLISLYFNFPLYLRNERFITSLYAILINLIKKYLFKSDELLFI